MYCRVKKFDADTDPYSTDVIVDIQLLQLSPAMYSEYLLPNMMIRIGPSRDACRISRLIEIGWIHRPRLGLNSSSEIRN